MNSDLATEAVNGVTVLHRTVAKSVGNTDDDRLGVPVVGSEPKLWPTSSTKNALTHFGPKLYETLALGPLRPPIPFRYFWPTANPIVIERMHMSANEECGSERGRYSRSRRAVRLTGAALATLAMTVGSQAFVSDAAQARPARYSAVRSDVQINQSLDAAAKLLASAVTDPQLRREIRDGAAQRFDGDTNVLWQALKTRPGVRSALATTHNGEQSGRLLYALRTIDELTTDMPRFQVAVPEKLDSWDPATYTPLVAYMPEGVDDTTLKTITAYDASGKAYQLDAQNAPPLPVIVLGLNERTDASGNLLKEPQASPQPMTALASTYEVRMVKVHLINDNEPWAKGSAEISLRAKSVGCGGTAYTDIDWSSLNDDEDWWYGPRYLGSTTCDVIFYWWEDDGSSFDFTLSYKGISLNVQMDDGDDLIGGIRRLHSSFEGGSDNKSEWSDLVQWTD